MDGVNYSTEKNETVKKENHARLRQIVAVFQKKHMLGNFIRQKNPAEFREGLEELGPTFVKIGQILSVRLDIVSKEYAEELEKLQGNNKSSDWEVIRPVLQKNLGCPISDVFSSIEETAFASASIAQVHRAVLKEGEQEVVVKIQHPGIEKTIEQDFTLLYKLIPLAEKTPFAKNVNFREMLGEFHTSIREELDFQNEAKNTERFFENNHKEFGISSPKVFTKWSTNELLLLEEMHGQELSGYFEKTNTAFLVGDENEKERRARIANRLIQNYFKQVFEDAFFHADPHPGNIMIELAPEGETFEASLKVRHMEMGPVEVDFSKQAEADLTEKIIWLDFGMMGNLDKGIQQKLKQVIIAVFGQNSHQIAMAILALCPAQGNLDQLAFEEKVNTLFQKYYTMPMVEMQIGNILEDATSLCREFHLKLPNSIVLLARGAGTLQGIVDTLNPEVSIMEVIEPYVARFMLEDFSVKDTAREYGEMVWMMMNHFPKIPEKMYSILEQVEDGRLKIQSEQGKNPREEKFEEKQLRRLITGFLSGIFLLTGAILELASSRFGAVAGGISFFLGIFLMLLLFWDFYKNRKK